MCGDLVLSSMVLLIVDVFEEIGLYILICRFEEEKVEF